jgi:hypothetical protein
MVSLFDILSLMCSSAKGFESCARLVGLFNLCVVWRSLARFALFR